MDWRSGFEGLFTDSQRRLHLFAGPILEGLRRQQQVNHAQTKQLTDVARAEKEAEKRVLPYLIERGWYITYYFDPFLFTPIDDFRTEFGEKFVRCGIQATLLGPLFEKWSLVTKTDERDDRKKIEPWFGPLN
jgi:hypothetical protein